MNKRGINFMKIASVAKLPPCFQKHQNRHVLNNVWTLFLPNKNSALQGDWWHDGNTTLWSEASVNNSRCGSWREQSVAEKGETWISPESFGPFWGDWIELNLLDKLSLFLQSGCSDKTAFRRWGGLHLAVPQHLFTQRKTERQSHGTSGITWR